MYLGTLAQISDDEGVKNQSEAAARQAAQELFSKYEMDCKGISLLKRLRKTKFSPYDEALLLQKRIDELPQLYEDKAELDLRAQKWLMSREKHRVFSNPIIERKRIEEVERRTNWLSPQSHRIEMAKLLVKLGYPPDYVLKDLNTELRIAKCEQSLNSLRFAFPCGGIEVDEPTVVAKQVAEHYAQTEIGTAISSQRVTCSLSGRSGFCDVHFPKGIVIRVNLGKVPYALHAVQVAPKVGPEREYSYACFGRKVNLTLPVKRAP